MEKEGRRLDEVERCFQAFGATAKRYRAKARYHHWVGPGWLHSSGVPWWGWLRVWPPVATHSAGENNPQVSFVISG